MSLAHLGDGQRQLLPALVQALFSEPGITLAWEHPDLHLHPGASTGLGRIAYRLAGAGRTVIIETHNQDLVSGICSEAAAVRVRHARTSGDEGLELSHAVLIYLRRQDSGCAHESYRLDDPEVELPMWPGFFDLEVIDRRRFEQSMSPIFSPTDAAHVRKLLSRGEGQSIEFKATLAWNLETGAKDPEIVYSAMRTIAAFCNSCEGGFLLIGVDDKATPVGLDPCFDGRDAFQKRLIEAVREWFPAFPALFESHLAISFERVDERDVAVVQCRPAKEPVFLYDVRKQREVILIRVGCTSQPLPSGQEAKWMKDRFSS